MRKLIALLALALPIMFGTASAAPNVHLMIDNPAPKFGDTITVSWDFHKGINGQSEAAWTMYCYQDSPAGGVVQVAWVWSYSERTFHLGGLPVPDRPDGIGGFFTYPYQGSTWTSGAAECEVYLSSYHYHQGTFTGADTIAEIEFDVAAS